MSEHVTIGPDGRATIDRSGIVENILSEVKPVFGASALSQTARDAFDDAGSAIREHVSASKQHDADMAELRAKRDLIPQAGYQRLLRDANEEARVRKDGAGHRFDLRVKELKEALEADALPRYEPSREQLARQELAIAIGEATGREAANRARTIAQSGSREAAAVLLRDPFGRSLLEARGVTGRELDDTLATARRVAVSLAIERGATERERAAAAALSKLTTLTATRGAAGR